MAPKVHLLEFSEMAPKDHVWESADMAPKDYVLESVGLLGPVSVAYTSTAEVAAGATSVAEARPPGGAKYRAMTAASAGAKFSWCG